jgi:hypothetical protein
MSVNGASTILGLASWIIKQQYSGDETKSDYRLPLWGQNASNDIATVWSLYALVFNFTNMHAISHRSDFFLACSSKVNI